MKPSDFLTELSNEKLAQYKTAASADASKADKAGDFKKGNKRFSGIVKATNKQFANDAKSGVSKGILAELDMFAPRTVYFKMADGNYIKADYRGSEGLTGHKANDNVTFTGMSWVPVNTARSLGLDKFLAKGSDPSTTASQNAQNIVGTSSPGEGPLGDRTIDVVDFVNSKEDTVPSALKTKVMQWVEKNTPQQQVAETFGLNYPGTYEQTNDMFKSSGQRRIGSLTTEDEQIDGMAQGEIREIIKNAIHIKNQLDKGVSLDGWMYSYVTTSNDHLNSVAEQINNPNIDEQGVAEEWSQKYKKSINCSHPKGFSQKAHCAGKKKHNESIPDYTNLLEMTCPDCGMCQSHGDNSKDKLDELKCWSGYHRVSGTKAGFPGSCAKNKTNEELDIEEDRENFNGINLLLQKDDEEVFVKASAGSRELGHVLFVIDGDYLMPQDLEVEERYRGQGIAQTMYDFVKSKGYKIRRSGQQTDAGAGFWAKHRPEQNVWEERPSESCPHCGGEMVSEELMNEKKDACYYKVKSRYKVWPSAYASGALVKCRNKGASNWGNGGKKNESSILEGIESVDESLHDWFNKEKWVRMDTKGNIKGPCAKEPGEGKPKCLPQAKAHSLGKKGRASAAARKRREDPNPDRSGKAINVNTKKEK